MRTWLLKGGMPVEAGDPLDDRGFTHGLGVFETMLMIDGRIIAPDLHFERMVDGCLKLGIEPPERLFLLTVGMDLGGRTRGRWRLRVVRTAGPGKLNDLGGLEPRTLVSLAECPPVPASLRAATVPWPVNELSPLAGVKCCSYAENLVVLDHARRRGADEAIRFNVRGQVCEGATSNVFMVVDGRLVTPSLDSGCLPGTARRRVIGLARELAIPIVERKVGEDELKSAGCVFLTSATRGVVPVSNLDGRDLGEPPELVARLRDGFEATWAGR